MRAAGHATPPACAIGQSLTARRTRRWASTPGGPNVPTSSRRWSASSDARVPGVSKSRRARLDVSPSLRQAGQPPDPLRRHVEQPPQYLPPEIVVHSVLPANVRAEIDRRTLIPQLQIRI